MPSGKWVDYAAQSMIHAFVAGMAMEALLRLWRARAPDDRLALRLLGLCQPLFVTPALFLFMPERGGEEFHDRWAIFAARHWEELSFLGVTAFHAGVAVLAFLGTALFAMDVATLVRGRGRALPGASPPPPELAAALARAAEGMRVAAPRLRFLELRGPLLFCAGVRRAVLVVSRGALELLDAEELEAALRHELAHVRERDPTLSWMLMALRAFLFFNPAAQIVARALTRDAEWRADELAGGDRLALASAVLKLHRAGLARDSTGRARWLAGALRRARSHDVEARCRRLLEPAPPARVPFRGARVALATASLAVLACLVT
jgi:Zn-dependent protease with chaperone function